MCNEYDMMKDIEQHGPIVVSFIPGRDLNLYKSGIYEKDNSNTWVDKNETQPEFEQVDHSGSIFLLKSCAMDGGSKTELSIGNLLIVGESSGEKKVLFTLKVILS